MKIVYILDWPINSIGGAQKSTYTIASEMKKTGNDVYICCPKSDIDELTDSVKYIFHSVYGNGVKDKIKKIQFYKKIFNLYKFDIVHIQNPSSFSLIGIMLLCGYLKKNNTRFIFTDRDFLEAYKKTQKILFRLIAHKFEMIVCTTDRNKKQWNQMINKVLLIPNVLDSKWYNFDKDRYKQVRELNNIKEQFVLGFAGRFVKYKRWDTVYDICKQLRDKDVTFLFAFGTIDEFEDSELEKYIKKLDEIIKGRYLYIKNVGQEEMMDFYYSIDCFILTSNNESFGRTLLEAMTKKCIVIGTNSGGVPEVIGSPEYLFEVGDTAKATEIVTKYICNREEANLVQEFFYNRVMIHYCKEMMVDKHIKLYKEVLSKEKGNDYNL